MQARTAALDAFVRFTEAAGTITDVLKLAARAVDVLTVMFPGCSAAYYALEGGLWKMRVHSTDMAENPALVDLAHAGLPQDTPIFARPWQTREPVFVDGWDAAQEQFARTEAYQIEAYQWAATYPLRLGGEVYAMFVTGFKQAEPWSESARAVFRSVGRSLDLALERTEQARQIDEERAALAAFTSFTETVGTQTDVVALVRRASQLLQETRAIDVNYFERDGDLFRLRLWTENFPATLLARNQLGLTLEQPSLALAARTQGTVFIDHWDAAAQGVPESSMYSSLAVQPFFQGEVMTSVMVVGSRSRPEWPERDRGIFRAVGHSLALALERAEQTRQLTEQRDLLEGRTEALEASNEELEAFTYSVSHDLRTPVRHIVSFLGLLRRTLPGPLGERAEHYLSVVDDSAAQLNHLIDSMLDLSRTSRQPMHLGPVDLGKLLAVLRAELAPELVGRQVVWQLGVLPVVTGDSSLLRRVALTLLSNALKFTRPRSQAVIDLWAEERPGEWAVFVRDNGVGFDPRYQAKLFTVFQRLHRQEDFEGAGVSLANARRIIARHGGTMLAQGAVDQGATFSFTLPRPGPARTEPEPRPSASP